MVSKVISAAPIGYEAEIIEVEGDCTKGLPSLQIVGMGNKAIDEAKERVRSAIKNSHLDFPSKKITINLAPAELPKDGTYFDLPIAISILILSGQLKPSEVDKMAFAGELSLSGGLRPIKGVLNITEALKKKNIKTVFLPEENISLAGLVDGIEIIGVSNLKQLFLHLKKEKPIANEITLKSSTKPSRATPTIDEIIGQDQAKRALTIAIAGRHNILLTGPPGTGKTMLAQAALGLLPKLSSEEILEVSKIHNLLDNNFEAVFDRPFRTPHHTASKTSIIGGGPKALPGEISLAHLGVLFLDEMPEYPRSLLEALRQPLEDKKVTISRTNRSNTYPANFMLIATMNPCPCGYYGDITKQCTRSTTQIINYQRKLSGPLLDRIDMVISVNRIDNENLLKTPENNKSKHVEISKQIESSLKIQQKRFKCSNLYNGMMKMNDIKHSLLLTDEAKNFTDIATKKLDLSARSYLKILKVARTIADLDNSKNVTIEHVSEALQYRNKQEKA